MLINQLHVLMSQHCLAHQHMYLTTPDLHNGTNFYTMKV